MRVQLRGQFDREPKLSRDLALNLRRALASFLADVQIHANGHAADAQAPLQVLSLQLRQRDPILIIADGEDSAAAANVTLYVLGRPSR